MLVCTVLVLIVRNFEEYVLRYFKCFWGRFQDCVSEDNFLQSCFLDFLDFVGWIGVFIPKSVAVSQSLEILGNDCCSDFPQISTWQWVFRNNPNPQIHKLDIRYYFGKFGHCFPVSGDLWEIFDLFNF